MQLAQKTHMNVQYAEECLRQNDWDLERAYANFVELHAAGRLPAAAFVGSK